LSRQTYFTFSCHISLPNIIVPALPSYAQYFTRTTNFRCLHIIPSSRCLCWLSVYICLLLFFVKIWQLFAIFEFISVTFIILLLFNLLLYYSTTWNSVISLRFVSLCYLYLHQYGCLICFIICTIIVSPYVHNSIIIFRTLDYWKNRKNSNKASWNSTKYFVRSFIRNLI